MNRAWHRTGGKTIQAVPGGAATASSEAPRGRVPGSATSGEVDVGFRPSQEAPWLATASPDWVVEDWAHETAWRASSCSSSSPHTCPSSAATASERTIRYNAQRATGRGYLPSPRLSKSRRKTHHMQGGGSGRLRGVLRHSGCGTTTLAAPDFHAPPELPDAATDHARVDHRIGSPEEADPAFAAALGDS